MEAVGLTMGEVHTGLLQNSTAVSQANAVLALALRPGGRVRRSERPMAYAVSPETFTGVDCRLATGSGTRVRGVGTVISRAAITGGHVLQASTVTTVTRAAVDRRLPWSYYLSRPGVLDCVGRLDPEDLVRGFLADRPPQGSLDLGAMSDRLMTEVQLSHLFDADPPFRAARTRVRWVLVPGRPGEERRLEFALESEALRTLRLTATVADPRVVAELCEDLALHDWLLTTLLGLIERHRPVGGSWDARIDRLRPAVDTLLHLWMPAARLDPAVLDLWAVLERVPGLTRQWDSSVRRIRDQIALSTITMLARANRESMGAP